MINHPFVSPAAPLGTGSGLADSAAWNAAHALGAGETLVIAMPNWWWNGSSAGLDNGYNVGPMDSPSTGVFLAPIDISWVTVADGCELVLSSAVIYNPLDGDGIPGGFSSRVFINDAGELHIDTFQGGVLALPAGPINFAILIVGSVVTIEP